MKKETITDIQTVAPIKKCIFDELSCPVAAAMRVIGGKWKPVLLNVMYQESPVRFGELRRALTGITQTMLTAQLRELEDDGIIHRKIYAEIPPKVEYTLTEFGKTLAPVIQAIAVWGTQHILHKKELKSTARNRPTDIE